MDGIALPRIKTKRRRRKPFGPVERLAMALLAICILWLCLCIWWAVDSMNHERYGWATYDLCWAAFYVWYIRKPWRVIKAWLDSEE